MNIVKSTIRNSKFKALVTLFILLLISHFFVVVKKSPAPVSENLNQAQSIAYPIRGRRERWQSVLWQWADISSPLIFTDIRRKMSFAYKPQVRRFPMSPIPLEDVTLEKALFDEALNIDSLIERYDFAVMLAGTFDNFSITPNHIKEVQEIIPVSTFFRTESGTVIDVIPDFDREILLSVKPETDKTVLQVSQIDSTFPRIVVKESCSSRDLDIAAVRNLSSFLVQSDNKPLFKKFFPEQEEVVVEVAWMWRGEDD